MLQIAVAIVDACLPVGRIVFKIWPGKRISIGIDQLRHGFYQRYPIVGFECRNGIGEEFRQR